VIIKTQQKESLIMDKKVGLIYRKKKSKDFIPNPKIRSKGTALRNQYIEDMNLAGYSERTVSRYTFIMVRISKYLRKSPMYFTDEDIRRYFKYLRDERNLAPKTMAMEHAALKFFYAATYPKDIRFIKLYKARVIKKIPAVLSASEVRRILKYVREPCCHACLSLIYSCGLRINEAISLKVSNVDSERMLIHIKEGKGGKDRYVPLPQKTLKILRELWKTHRHPSLLFPSRKRRSVNCRRKNQHNNHISTSTISMALKYAALESGCHKEISVHTLRHSYATHLIEAEIPLHVVQSNLGHEHLSTTGIYTHMTDKFHRDGAAKLDHLMDSVL
jgi:site-specific recombinase XerD